MPIDIQQSFNQSKKSLDDNLNLLISRLAERGSLIKTGYGEMQDFSIDIALEDHLNKKPIITPPTNLNYYIPNSPGNQQMRSLIFESGEVIISGGMKKITSKKRYTKKKKNKK